MKIKRLALAIAVAIFVNALWVADAFAATSGPTMPWDRPLTILQDNMSGTLAHIFLVAAIVLTGIIWMFSDGGTVFRRVASIAFGGAIALGAVSMMTSLGFAGAII